MIEIEQAVEELVAGAHGEQELPIRVVEIEDGIGRLLVSEPPGEIRRVEIQPMRGEIDDRGQLQDTGMARERERTWRGSMRCG